MRAGEVLLTHIEDLIAAGNAKVSARRVNLSETFDAAVYAGKFGFKMAVREKYKVEVVGILFGWSERHGKRLHQSKRLPAGKRGRSTKGQGRFEKRPS